MESLEIIEEVKSDEKVVDLVKGNALLGFSSVLHLSGEETCQ
jgi:hypothetical protein